MTERAGYRLPGVLECPLLGELNGTLHGGVGSIAEWRVWGRAAPKRRLGKSATVFHRLSNPQSDVLVAHFLISIRLHIATDVSEATGIKVADIDSSRMVIHVEQGKGGRDRYVILSPQLLGILLPY
jgi:integrase